MSCNADPRRLVGAPFEEQRNFLVKALLADQTAATLLSRLPSLQAPSVWLVAGAIYQNVWNALTGRPAGFGVRDYDLAYFDRSDLSWDAEDRVIQACAKLFADLSAPVEIRNQARVHLWFAKKFNVKRPAFTSVQAAINAYPVAAHKVAIRVSGGGELDLFAPAGLDPVFSMTIEPKGPLADPEGFAAKHQRMKAVWPELIIPGDS